MEDFKKFTDHKDPTKKIDYSSVTMEEQFAKLTEEEKLILGCKSLGMSVVPVSIDQFVSDSYYLGHELLTNEGKGVFDFWKDKFRDIFPTPIFTRYPYLSFGGALGIGKSSTARLISLYIYHRLDCLSNLYTSLHMQGGAKVSMIFVHANITTAEKDFIGYIKESVFENSPYFGHLYNLKKNQIRLIAAGPRTNSIIGTNPCVVVLSEVGFIKPQDGVSRVNECLGRIESRYKDLRFNFVSAICDSSAKDINNAAVKTFENGMNPNELLKIKPSQWLVRPNLFSESNGKTFKLYLGDSVREPYIIENEEDIERDDLDKDNIYDIPESARYRFMIDTPKAIMDILGKEFSRDEMFFKNLEHFIKCSSLRNLIPEIITVDFYNKNDSIFNAVSPMVYRIPRGTTLHLAYDIGISKDITGVAAAYYSGETMVGNASLPTFKIPFVFGVSRIKGQSTSLLHLYQFIKDLIANGYYINFSADSFGSIGLFQSLERDHIPYKTISVDRTMEAGILFKNLINTDRVELPRVERLLREASEIRIVGTGKNGDHMKLDHPLISSCFDFDYKDSKGKDMPGSKDLFDSCCQAIFNAYQQYSEYKEGGVGGAISKSMKAMDSITKDPREETAKVFQDMIESIW